MRELSRRSFLQFAPLAVTAASCGKADQRVLVFHAGSLSQLVEEIARRFEESHPTVRIDSESSGSLDAIRKVTDLGRACDLLLTADHRLLARFIVPDRAFRYHKLVGNEMVLAGARNATWVEREWRDDWYSNLLGHTFGISDPARDPAGYFAHLVWKLAEIHYNRPGLYRSLSSRLDSRWMRPKSSELVALLEVGVLDFAFLYLSTAVQNHLPYLRFPPQVSLGDPAYGEVYARVFTLIPSPDHPQLKIEIQGAPIRAGVALLRPDREAATSLLKFLISSEAQEMFRGLGYTGIPVREIISAR